MQCSGFWVLDGVQSGHVNARLNYWVAYGGWLGSRVVSVLDSGAVLGSNRSCHAVGLLGYQF